MKELKINISADGEDVDIQVSGFEGAACLEATAEIEKALGVVEKKKKTPEYYRKGKGGNKQRVKGRA